MQGINTVSSGNPFGVIVLGQPTNLAQGRNDFSLGCVEPLHTMDPEFQKCLSMTLLESHTAFSQNKQPISYDFS
jgi:hypothetical protein